MPSGGCKSAKDDATDAGGATEAAACLAMIDLLREQQRMMLEQQRARQELMRSLIDQQKVEMMAHREKMAALLHKTTEVEERAKVRCPSPCYRSYRQTMTLSISLAPLREWRYSKGGHRTCGLYSWLVFCQGRLWQPTPVWQVMSLGTMRR